MDPLKQDGTVIIPEVVKQACISAATYNKRSSPEGIYQCHGTMVIEHPLTILFELRGTVPGTVQETMQRNPDSQLLQRPQTVKLVNCPSIIRRIRNVY
jgi:hypothetical protein